MVTVRFYAGARAAAGRTEQEVAAETLDRLLACLAHAHGDKLAMVLASSSYLVDGVAWHDRAAPLPAGATVDVLPPFAGG
jgi:molybdopterin synthase sulfur carrier subunit